MTASPESEVAESRRDEQKLWLILFQINAIRTRLNLLAIQYWVFGTLAILLALAALVFFGSLTLSPMVFLGVTLLAIGIAAPVLYRVFREARRRGANSSRAAAIADKRAALKGRLATILAMAKTPAANSPLWPYLVEDTYSRREAFEPARIESRWLSRAILPLIAVCATLALTPFAARLSMRTRGPAAITAPPAAITADVDNLEIEPADPGEAPNARVYADAATLKRLEAKLAQAKTTASKDSGLNRWMNRARRFAGDLQDRIAGRHLLASPPIDLRLRSEANPTLPNGGNSTVAQDSSNNGAGSSLPFAPAAGDTASDASGVKPPPVSLAPQQADQLAGNSSGQAPAPDSGQTQSDQDNSEMRGGATLDGGVGAMHSGGTDPAHLFGPPTPEQLGSDNFKIAIDAAPSDEASIPGATAYIPPEVRVPLNPQQAPDQPLARAVIPPTDQAAVRRVFER